MARFMAASVGKPLIFAELDAARDLATRKVGESTWLFLPPSAGRWQLGRFWFHTPIMGRRGWSHYLARGIMAPWQLFQAL
ncbi:MAG: hypothetical protein AB7K68_15360 [Bacteriovoracia bacterium]